MTVFDALPKKTQTGSGAPSFCWHCNKQLVRVRGGFIFSLIRDPDGHELRVHKQCQDDAAGHGYTKVKEAA